MGSFVTVVMKTKEKFAGRDIVDPGLMYCINVPSVGIFREYKDC